MSKINVGTKILIELSGMSGRLQSSFVGYVNKRFIIVAMPIVPQLNRDLLLANIYTGNSVTVRFIQFGSVFGFESSIVHFFHTPYPLLFLQYPETIETHNLRKQPRVDCLFPVTATFNGQESSGVLSNISQSGGQIFFLNTSFEGQAINIDDPLTFKCPSLFHSPDASVSSVIKRIHKQNKKMELGLKFVDIQEDMAVQLTEYIEQTILFSED